MNSHCLWHVSGDATVDEDGDKVTEREREDRERRQVTGGNKPHDLQVIQAKGEEYEAC